MNNFKTPNNIPFEDISKAYERFNQSTIIEYSSNIEEQIKTTTECSIKIEYINKTFDVIELITKVSTCEIHKNVISLKRNVIILN